MLHITCPHLEDAAAEGAGGVHQIVVHVPGSVVDEPGTTGRAGAVGFSHVCQQVRLVAKQAATFLLKRLDFNYGH